MGVFTDQSILDVSDFWDLEAEKNDKYFHEVDEEYSVAVFLSNDRYEHTSSSILERFLKDKFSLNNASIDELYEYLVKNHKYIDKGSKTSIPWKDFLYNGIPEKAYLWSYKIALRFQMEFDQFLKLLNSIEGESIDYRNAQEMIYAFCIARNESLEYAEDLYKEYKNGVKEQEQNDAPQKTTIEQGYTKSLSYVIDSSCSKDDFIKELITESEQLDSFKGLSITNTAKFIRLVEYVWAKYNDGNLNIVCGEDTSKRSETVIMPYKDKDQNVYSLIPAPDSLFYVMTGAHARTSLINESNQGGWEADIKTIVRNSNNVSEIIKTLANRLYFDFNEKTYQKAYLLYGKKFDNYYARVKRKEILLFLHFFIIAFMEDDTVVTTSELPDLNDNELPLLFKDVVNTGEINAFDNTMSKVQQWIINATKSQNSSSRSDMLRKYMDIFDEVLDEFGFYRIYLPNLYDRYFMINLISDDPEFNWDIKHLLENEYFR